MDNYNALYHTLLSGVLEVIDGMSPELPARQKLIELRDRVLQTEIAMASPQKITGNLTLTDPGRKYGG